MPMEETVGQALKNVPPNVQDSIKAAYTSLGTDSKNSTGLFTKGLLLCLILSSIKNTDDRVKVADIAEAALNEALKYDAAKEEDVRRLRRVIEKARAPQ